MDPNATLGGAPPIPSTGISSGYTDFLIVAAVFTALATSFVILRFLSRRLTKSTGLDDWMSLGSLIFIYAYLIVTALAATVGRAGYHLAGYNVKQFEQYLKLALASSTIYNCSLTLSKLAVLLFYRRIFDVRSFRIWIWIGCGVVVAYWFAAFFGLIFAFTPVEAQWKFYLPSKSIKNKTFWLTAGIINVTIDFCILCLPQIRVWKLQMSNSRKALLSLLFLLGFFTCITSIVRIVYLQRVNLLDITYTLGPAGIWTLLEADMSIICSCAPMLPALFRHWHDGHQSSMFKFSFSGSGLSRLIRKKDSSYQHGDVERSSASSQSHSDSSIHKEPKNSVHVQTDIDITRVSRHPGEGGPTEPGW